MKLLTNLHYTYGDRSEKSDFTKLLVYLSKKLDITEKSGKKWDCVIDFCAYRRSEVKVSKYFVCKKTECLSASLWSKPWRNSVNVMFLYLQVPP